MMIEPSDQTLKDVLTTNHTSLGSKILLLDGGVSTHLEDLILRQRNNSQTSQHYHQHQHQDHHQQQQQPVQNKQQQQQQQSTHDGDGVFPYRELWSSSLLLSEDGRQLIQQGHIDWIDAGVDILSTVTYQCHYESSLWPTNSHQQQQHQEQVLQEQKLTTIISHNNEISLVALPVVTKSVMDEMWHDGIELARNSIEQCKSRTSSSNSNSDKGKQNTKKVYVVASSGCYGAALANGAEYTGRYEDNHNQNKTSSKYRNKTNKVQEIDLYDFHCKKLQRILQLKPDGIAFETVPNLIECQEIVKLLTTPTTSCWNKMVDLPACWISLACQNESQLNDGTPLSVVIPLLLSSTSTNELQGIGFNCCHCDHLHSLVKTLIQYYIEYKQRRAIVIYPNSGEEWDAVKSTWKVGTGYTTPTDMAHKIASVIDTIETTWYNCSSTTIPPTTISIPTPTIIIGGCCRTRPSTIATLRSLIDARLARRNEK
jgi:S-methylmethionine-dependent homocysteine/selenocysteine methylase